MQFRHINSFLKVVHISMLFVIISKKKKIATVITLITPNCENGRHVIFPVLAFKVNTFAGCTND